MTSACFCLSFTSSFVGTQVPCRGHKKKKKDSFSFFASTGRHIIIRRCVAFTQLSARAAADAYSSFSATSAACDTIFSISQAAHAASSRLSTSSHRADTLAHVCSCANAAPLSDSAANVVMRFAATRAFSASRHSSTADIVAVGRGCPNELVCFAYAPYFVACWFGQKKREENKLRGVLL